MSRFEQTLQRDEEETDASFVFRVLSDPTDEIEAVLGHFRDEDHLQDPIDIPNLNLVSAFSPLLSSVPRR